jgi:hypothetical protein
MSKATQWKRAGSAPVSGDACARQYFYFYCGGGDGSCYDEGFCCGAEGDSGRGAGSYCGVGWSSARREQPVDYPGACCQTDAAWKRGASGWL